METSNSNPISLIQNLDKKVKDFSNKNEWQNYFIKQPEMIETDVFSNQKLIRWNTNQILLLTSKTVYGYHKQYYSNSLKSNRQIEKDSYRHQKS
jgi:hypothetical protein